MHTFNQNPRPAVVTYAIAAAWLHWVLAVILTVSYTARPQLLGVALPTLGTQALLTLGMGWGSNVARMSYFIWSLFGFILTASSADIVSTPSGLAEWAGMLDSGLMFAALVGLLLPAANAWFIAQRQQNKGASGYERLLRVKRNLKVAAAWLAILPASALIAIPLGTPILAVLTTSALATTVGLVVLMRQCFKFHRLQGYTA
jgi:hypothetical protein